MPFSHAPVGGNGNLVAQKIQSPNFVHAVSGWSINQDGSAEFHDIIIPAGSGGATVYFDSAAPASPNTGDLWYDTANGLALSQWDGTSWVAYSIGTGAITNGAITNPLLGSAAVGTSNLAAGIVYAGIVDATTINAATFTGSEFEGTDFIIGTTGAFFYNGTPALGNLVISVSQNSGVDAYGNTYVQGVTSYGSNTAITLWNNGVYAAIVMYLLLSKTVTVQPVLQSQPMNSTLVNELIQTVLSSGKESGNDDAALQLFSESADATVPAQAVIEFGGQAVAVFNRASLLSAIQPGTGATQETFHTITPQNGWAASSNASRYKLLPDNTVIVEIDLSDSAATTGTMFTLPTGYQPAYTQFFPVIIYNTAGSPAMCTCQITTGGAFNILQWGKQSKDFLATIVYSLD